MINFYIERAYYGAENVFENLRLTAHPGETVTLMGPSGCGKSTLLRILAGLHKGYLGRVVLPSEAVVGLVPQSKTLLPWKTVEQNLGLTAKAAGKKPDREEIRALISQLELDGLQNQYPHQLSGGQYQRVMLGQLLCLDPDILLLDEPFTALDSALKEKIIRLLLALRKPHSTTLFVTHSEEEAGMMQGKTMDFASLFPEIP